MNKLFLENLPLGNILFHRFRLISCLHASEECGVYLSADTHCRNRYVALKIYSVAHLIECGRMHTVAREVEVSHIVSHPHVARYDCIFEDEDFLAVSMEYFGGGTLARRIASRSRFSFEEVTKVLTQLALGIGALHSSSILHRDIKPENILIDESGNLRIADFGIALFEHEVPHHVGERMHGTIEYMSPEYIRSGVFSKVSDIYALGVIGYRMLTGMLPFEGDDVVDLLATRVLTDPATVSELRRDCPEQLERVVMKALSRHEELRFASCEEFLAALRAEALDQEWIELIEMIA